MRLIVSRVIVLLRYSQGDSLVLGTKHTTSQCVRSFTVVMTRYKVVLNTPLFQLDEMNELLSLREVRTPVRLRFGRRSEERAVPHIFPQEVAINSACLPNP